MKYISFYGSLHDCPYGSRLKTCPVYPMNDSSFEDKFNWFDGLTLAEKDSVAEHHEQCASRRIKKSDG